MADGLVPLTQAESADRDMCLSAVFRRCGAVLQKVIMGLAGKAVIGGSQRDEIDLSSF